MSGQPSEKFSLLSLSCLVVANTIGAGVYTTSGFTLGSMGSREAVLIVWLAASLVAMTGAVSFGALSRAIPESGGEYLYLSRLIHPGAGFIAGWVSLIAAFAGAEAYAAITIMEHVDLEVVPHMEEVLVVGLLIALACLHGFLVKAGTIMQNLTVLAKGAFILLFTAVGAAAISTPHDIAPAATDSFWVWPLNLMWVSLSFTGYNSAIYVAEEAENPIRDVPRAMLIGTAVTAILYLLINAVMLYSAPIDQLANSPQIALVAARALGGEPLRRAVQALVLLSLFTLLSGMAVAGPRVAVKMSEDGFLPPLNLKQAAIVQCALAVAMTLYSDLAGILTYLSLTLSLTSALTVVAVFRLPPKQQPNPVFPLTYVLGSALAAIASLRIRPQEGGAAIATIVSGALVYWILFGRRQGNGTRERIVTERTEGLV